MNNYKINGDLFLNASYGLVELVNYNWGKSQLKIEEMVQSIMVAYAKKVMDESFDLYVKESEIKIGDNAMPLDHEELFTKHL